MRKRNTVFPFVAVLGQDEIKNALIWNIVNPKIGGVLISGEKGTAKSTLVRGICSIAPDVQLVDLPLNITEDRLIGNIDFEHAVKYGEKRFEPGLLRQAHGNLLYVDEVNLLSDHIVKSLLESAASGMNIVEREGISFRHPSRFILAGSMNPEEGGLRPQFLDRFGLYVEVQGEADLRKRVEIIRRRVEYERSSLAFAEKWQDETARLAEKIKRAQEGLAEITVTQNAMQLAASISKEGNCAGHRAEIVIIETAKAIAALDARVALNISDIKEAAKYALPHRSRKNQTEQEDQIPQEGQEEQEEQFQSEENTQENAPSQDDRENDGDDHEQNNSPETDTSPADNKEQNRGGDDPLPENEDSSAAEMPTDGQSETVDDPGQTFMVSRWLSEKRNDTVQRGSGKRSLVTTSSMQGRYVRYCYPNKDKIRDIAIDATLRAAAPHQMYRTKNGMAIAIHKSDIRVKVREKRTGNSIIFVVDASGSMGANRRMSAVKGAILSLLNDAYQKRDRVGLIAFRRDAAELLLGITRSVELAEKQLTVLPTGGRTPLAAGLDMAYDVVKAGKIKDKDMLPVIVLVTDGRATYSRNGINAFADALRAAEKIASEKIKSIVIDTDQNFIQLNLAEELAKAMNADRYQIEELHAESVVAAVALSL